MGADLTSAKFIKCIFDEVEFQHTEMEDIDIRSCVFRHSSLLECTFDEAYIQANFHNSHWWQCRFNHATFCKVEMMGSSFLGISGGSKLTLPADSDIADLMEDDERPLSGCSFDTCDFLFCNFTGLHFGESSFIRCGFAQSKLCNTDLSKSVQTLMHAFRACDLDGALLPPGTQTTSGIPVLDREFASLNRVNTLIVVLSLYFFVAHLSAQDLYEFSIQPISIRLPYHHFLWLLTAVLLVLQIFSAFRAQRLAVSLALAPAIFEDGLPLPEKVGSGLYSDLIWRFKAVPHEERQLRPPPYSVPSLVLCTAASFFPVPIALFAVSIENILRGAPLWFQVAPLAAFTLSALSAAFFLHQFSVELSSAINDRD